MTSFDMTSVAGQSTVILITGLVVVFAVLLLLIGIILIYSSIVTGIQKLANRPKTKKEEKPSVTPAPDLTVVPAPLAVSSGFDADLQTIAVISAAVEAFYSGSGTKARIASIRRTSSPRSEWASAGITQNISARRGF